MSFSTRRRKKNIKEFLFESKQSKLPGKRGESQMDKLKYQVFSGSLKKKKSFKKNINK